MAQRLGFFVGGAGGGLPYSSFGMQSVFYACAIAALIWALFALGMKVAASLIIYDACRSFESSRCRITG